MQGVLSGTALSRPDSGNVRRATSVSTGERFLRLSAFSYFAYLRVRQSAIPMVKAVVMAALYTCVCIVCGNRSYPQMGRPNARRIVALVHQYLPLRDFADKFLVHKAMGANPYFARSACNRNYAVSKTVSVASPEPACRGFLDSRFERNRSHDKFVFVDGTQAMLLRITQFAKVSAECWRSAKKAFSITLFHDRPGCNGPVMTLP